MEYAGIAVAVLGMLCLEGAAIFVLAYWGARLAIRHERRAQPN